MLLLLDYWLCAETNQDLDLQVAERDTPDKQLLGSRGLSFRC